MGTDRFDNLLRGLSTGPSRRGVLASLAGGLLVALPRALGVEEATAKKKGKKRRGGRPPPPTCAQLCPQPIADCASRPVGAPLCTNGYSYTCVPCSTDQDCIDLSQPYCVTAIIDRSTGQVFPVKGLGTSCPNVTSPGVCADLDRP